MKNEGTILTTGVAEVSVKEIIALEKSVTDKDQTIGALQEQVKHLETKVEDTKKDQKVVIVRKTVNNGMRINMYGNIDYNTPKETEEVIGYRNLETVIEDIRKEEAKKLGFDLNELENKIGLAELEKTKVQNTSNLKVKELEESLKNEKKEKESEIASAKEKIRKNMTVLIDTLNNEVDELQDELRKVKKDKTDEAVEEARKQEIILLKERIHELEVSTLETPQFGWFKMLFYNWLKVDARAKIQAEREVIEKKNRIDKISNNYPTNKSWWAPEWLFSGSDPWNW